MHLATGKVGLTHHVAGVGASAGGIHALRSLVSGLPEKVGLAFVVVQHLSPDQPSLLVELLAKHASLAVRQVTDGMAIEVDHIYVAAPNRAVTVEGGLLRSRPFMGNARPGIDTIDTLFESLAKDLGPKAIGIVLSGTGADGAAGVVRIKQAGGMVFVQDPVTAMHNGMPCAAIATGAVDHVMAVEALGHELMVYASGPGLLSDAAGAWNKQSGKAVEEILAIVYRYANFDLSGYKVTPLLWRIQQRMNVRRVRHYADYRDLLHDDAAEVESLIRGLPIHVTAFFRDEKAWGVLRQDVIEPLVAGHPGDRPIRAWTPACSTGEEAYSVAMLLAEAFGSDNGNQNGSKPFQVFGTDALPEIVAHASRGQFSAAAVEALDAGRRSEFFYKVDGSYRVKRTLRERLVFAEHRLLSDAPFSDLDLITCRNLLIYLEPEAQQQVLALLHASLRMGGFLFLGSGESLSPKQAGFEAVSKRWHIYRKVGPATKVNVVFPRQVKAGDSRKSLEALLAGTAHQALIERIDVPSVLIDEHFTILRVYGDTNQILRLPPGEPTHDLRQVLKPKLVPYLETAVAQAQADHNTVTKAHLPELGDGGRAILRVTPLQGGGTSRLLVSFLAGAFSRDSSAGGGVAADDGDAMINESNAEALKVSIQELEASREELQALNEELRAVNEQLNISNDEINEVNAQLRGKIEELETQSNVLSSGRVTTLFLDEDLRVRWFTPAVAELFPLQPADTGRRITDLVPRFSDPRFLEDVRAIMKQGELLEAEVRRNDGRWFLRQIRPFRIPTMSTSGVAITFNDITDRKLASKALGASEQKFRTLFESMDEGYLLGEVIFDGNDKAVDIQFLEANPAAIRLAGRDFAGRRMRAIDPGYEEYWYEAYGGVALTGQSVHAEHYAGPHKRWFDFRLSKVGGPDSRLVACVFQDINERKCAEAVMAEELRHTRILQDLSARLVTDQGMQTIYDEILTAAIEITGAAAGSVQMLDEKTQQLVILAACGFGRDARDYFHFVDAGSNTSCGVALRTGARSYFDFDPANDDKAVRLHVNEGIFSAQSSPLISRSGRAIGMVSTHWREAGHRPSERELRFLDLLARQAADVIERGMADQALRESEAKYRTVFEAMDEGFVTAELIYDDQGRAADVLYLEGNPAASRLTGGRETNHRRLSELLPGADEYWVEIYDRVARTGVAERLERFLAPLDRWYDFLVSRVSAGVAGGSERPRVAIVFQDITARRRAEEGLRRSEERLRNVLDSMAEGFALFGPDFTILDVNDETVRADGRPREALVGRSHWEAYPDTEHSALGELYKRCMRERSSGAMEFVYHRPDGRIMWVDVRVYPNPDGRLACFWRDITDRKRIEKALKGSEEQFRTLADTAPALIWRNDATGENRFINRHFVEYTGMTAEQIAGEGWHALVHPDDAWAYIADYLSAVRDRRAWRGRNRIRRHDGMWRWFENHACPLLGSGGEYLGHVGVSVDVHDAVTAEDALRDSKVRFQSIANLVPDLLWSSRADGYTDWYNQRWSEYTGQTFEEAIGWGWTRAIHPDDWELSARRYREAVESGTTLVQEHRIRRHDGEYRWFLVRAEPVCDPAGNVTMFGSATDVHAQRTMMTAMRDSKQRLERELADVEQLQAISRLFFAQDDIRPICDAIVNAAAAILRSDAASLQMLDSRKNDLRLLAWRGFHTESAAYWQRVSSTSTSTCGAALESGRRRMVVDVNDPACGVTSGNLREYRRSGIVAVQSTPLISRDGIVVGMISTHWSQRHEPDERELARFDVLARLAADVIERTRAQEEVGERAAWVRGQSEALQTAVNDASLKASLGILVRVVVEALGDGTRAAFYLGNTDNTTLRHVVGMGEDYVKELSGFKTGPESLSCDSATHRGEPVLTADVLTEPRWKPWRPLAERFDYRGCWSFPIHAARGQFMGALAIYSRQPRQATKRELELASLLTSTAAIIISRHNESEVHMRDEALARESGKDGGMGKSV